MSPLAKYIFMFLVNHTGPGNSVYSMELVPTCGTSKDAPACELTPVCPGESPLCAAPRWSAFRGGWARVETKETAARRYYNAAEALARTATYLTRCKDEAGSVLEECTPIRWPEGPHSAACAMLSSSIWESGYREDIMVGAPPSGRGPDGEGCVMQVMPQHIANNVSWLTDEERVKLTPEEIVQRVLGTDQASLERCYEAGGRMLAKFRGAASHTCRGTSWTYSMYSMYGTGGRCTATPRGVVEDEKLDANGMVVLDPDVKLKPRQKDWAAQREDTYKACMSRWPDGERLPDWATAVLTRTGDSRVALVK
jgi:hypothetical protein